MNGSFSRTWGKLTESMLFLPTAALLLILIADFFLIPGFFSLQVKSGHLYGNVIDILVHGSPTMILAMGMTLVIATGGVDLSVGAIMAITSSVACVMINPTIVGMNLTDPQKFINDPQYTWAPLWAVVVVPMVIATLCGLWNGMLVSYGRIQPMVATLVLMIAGRGIAQLITNAIQIIIFNDTYAFIGNGYVILPFSLYVAVAVFIGAWLLTRRTSIGLFIESVGINYRSSFYSGINEKKIKLFAYGFCGFCAGIAGLIVTSNIRTSDANQIGMYTELDAILAVVIGGTLLGTGGRFSLMGSAIGALVLQTTITSMLSFGVPASAVIAVKALVVIAVVLLYAEQVKGFVRRLGGSSLRRETAQ
ncbi:MAG: ABC transporter permease [Candidatus Limnocylindrales bacterium]|jgi:simple sugar transport system permease protein